MTEIFNRDDGQEQHDDIHGNDSSVGGISDLWDSIGHGIGGATAYAGFLRSIEEGNEFYGARNFGFNTTPHLPSHINY